MAKILMSGLVTAIAGSVGGTTFRRSPFGVVVSNKSMGYSRNKLLMNTSLLKLAQVRSDWNRLSHIEKSNWNNVALANEFPDRFGNPIKLTGRMLFTKCWGSLILSGTSIPLASSFNRLTYKYELIVSDAYLASNVLEVKINNPLGNQWYYFALDYIGQSNPQPVFNRRKSFAITYITTSTLFSAFNELLEQYPFAKVGDKCRLYVQVASSSGVKSTWKYRDFEIKA